MTVKKNYNVKDVVWIAGISRNGAKLTQGTVVSKLDLSAEGYTGMYYVIAIPTGIEDLLEIRSWETMSQDANGPVGALRSIAVRDRLETIQTKTSQWGLECDFENQNDLDDPTPEQIHAAMDRSEKANMHTPLVIKESKPKRRYPPRKKKS